MNEANEIKATTARREIGFEEALLGSMLREPAVLNDVVALVRKEDFRTDAGQKVFAVLVELYERSQPADLSTVADRLRTRGWIEDIGGYSWLAQLWDSQPTGALASHYARKVRDAAIIREVGRVGAELVSLAGQPAGTADEVLDTAQRLLFEAASGRTTGTVLTLAQALAEASKRIDSRFAPQDATERPRSGFLDLDRKIVHLSPGELFLIGGRTGMGKTALALSMVRNLILRQGVPVLFFTLEMEPAELAERMLSSDAGVDGMNLRKGKVNATETALLVEALDRLNPAPLYIANDPVQTILRITATARRYKMQRGVRVVVIDYIQLITTDQPKLPRHEQVSTFSRRLKLLARELELPIIALCQVNRGSENRTDRRPRLADLRESGSLEQDSDTVLLLHQPDDRPELLEVNVAKNRDGATGECLLVFNKALQRFENYAEDAESPFQE